MTEYFDVAGINDIPVGQARAFQVQEKIVGVFNCQGEFLAIDDICPHAGASLSAAHLEGETVSCPWHAWRFNLRDGTWCDNRRLKVDAYEVRVADGRILIGIPNGDQESASG